MTSYLSLLLFLLPQVSAVAVAAPYPYPNPNPNPYPHPRPIPEALAQSLPYISPTDDSSRIIPATVENPDTGEAQNTSAQLCGTPPPPGGLRDKLNQLQNARAHEKRGLSHEESGLKGMGLEKRDVAASE
ncbi:uncharacterized protein KY384_000324 [Bacidia gigantensis]|uniref:uncharacterized protein n=1 Tax=Bacidia gigantensis TaxID=2732470 RepID=UPI001D03DD3E|nr:uncharacterized protein KY384_000324 [Bacidia gigantensis]KAG8526331.1 hypothetical protein KY384_000324 [Bacidia gigantensis]